MVHAVKRSAIAAAVVGGDVLAAASCFVWNQHEAGAVPKGIISINRRVEATQVDTGAAQALGSDPAHRQRFGFSRC